jgi:hypothetical protein
MLRYQAQAERQYRRAVEEFERLKALRDELPDELLPNEPATDPQPEQTEATSTPPGPNPILPQEPALPTAAHAESANRTADSGKRPPCSEKGLPPRTDILAFP